MAGSFFYPPQILALINQLSGRMFYMGTYRRTDARRNNRHRAGGLLFFTTLLALTVTCAITAYASANQPTTVIAGSYGEDMSRTKTNQEHTSAAQQPESVSMSDRQPGGGNSPAHNDSESWMLTLVNAENPLPSDHSPKLKSLANGLQFDERAIDQLNAMLSAAREQGLSPVVCSAYRSIEKQRTLLNNQTEYQVTRGLSREQAAIEARKVIAYPGTSEHNLGLAADIVSINYQSLDEAQADTPEAKWLKEHCSEYGFILRYPKDKTDITGIIYEPWHFRYVGVEAAKEIMESGLCLEEYLAG